jgi:hypothetical protein
LENSATCLGNLTSNRIQITKLQDQGCGIKSWYVCSLFRVFETVDQIDFTLIELYFQAKGLKLIVLKQDYHVELAHHPQTLASFKSYR